MKVKVFQKGFNYSQDGQGNRLVIHLQGCNMSCPWCSNPEGMPINGVLVTEKEWLRESCCPRGAVKGGQLNREICVECEERLCIKKRRQKGIRLSCREYEVDDLVRECIASKPMFFDGGGVTLTGGEIGMQFEAVREILAKLGETGIHRAIESNCSHPHMTELIPVVDQWIMDIKHYDNEKHKNWLGVENTTITKNLKKVSEEHLDLLVRVPLIPGFNDSEEDAKGFAEYFLKYMDRRNARLEFLTYHEFGKGKWEQCGLEYKMKSGRIAPETVKYFEKVMKNFHITCIHT